MIYSFKNDDIKSYLKYTTGYEVMSIYSINNESNWINVNFDISENQTVTIIAMCDATRTKAFKKYTIKQFLWTQEIKIKDFLKYVRKKKLNIINKNSNY